MKNIRKELHNYIDKADERFINMIYAMIQVYTKEDEIIGYTVEGKPIDKTKLEKRIQEAEKRIDAGNFVSQEDLEKEARNW